MYNSSKIITSQSFQVSWFISTFPLNFPLGDVNSSLQKMSNRIRNHQIFWYLSRWCWRAEASSPSLGTRQSSWSLRHNWRPAPVEAWETWDRPAASPHSGNIWKNKINNLQYYCISKNWPVFLDVLRAWLVGPEPLVPVLDQQPLDEVPGHWLNVPRPLHPARQDLLVDTEWIVVEEGRIAGQHLVYEDPEGPPVHGLVVALALDDLRGEVLGSPAQGPGPVWDLQQTGVTTDQARSVSSMMSYWPNLCITLSHLLTSFEKPKSTILRCPSLSRRRFSGLRSL